MSPLIAVDFAAVVITMAVVVSFLGFHYLARRRGRAESHARVTSLGSSEVMGQNGIAAAYWGAAGIGRRLAGMGITANAITWAALILGLFAGVALAFRLPGTASVLMVVAGLCDLVDGAVARASGTSSPAGEAFDAVVDRYVDQAILAGIAVAWRGEPVLLLLALGAATAAAMVTLSTAKAEALGVRIASSRMRRHDRFGLIAAGCMLSAAVAPLLDRVGVATAWAEVPLVLAVAMIAVVGNITAIGRFMSIARAVRAREAAAPDSAGAELGSPKVGHLVGRRRAPIE